KRKATKKTKSEQPSLFDQKASEVASGNGKPAADTIIPATRPAEDVKPDDVDERRRIEDSIKNEVLQTLSERADRFLQVRGTILVPYGPFAAPSAECVEQFRDGHFFGCIALTQAVVEAVIRHVWQVNL